jgi:hypothetical protein
MYGWLFQNSEAVLIALAVVLVMLAVAAIRSAARLRVLGGPGESDPLEDQYIHGRIDFEAYQKAKQHAQVH